MRKNLSLSYSRLIITFTLSIILYACGGGSNSGSDSDSVQNDEPSPSQDIVSVLVAGDSISTGFNLATPWPDRLLGISIDNSFSEDGVETGFGLSYLADAITTLNPSHVVIFLGTNDAIRGSVSVAISNLQEMINIANAQNVSVIIATLPVITRSGTENARAVEISNAIRVFSNVQVADIRATFGDGAGLIADGIHPNDAGQQLIADIMVGFF